LIAALRPEDRGLWGCAFYAGLRRGELRALLWRDVDLADGLIRVERSMSGHGETGEPKSRAGRRGVPIVAALRDLLVEHKLVTRDAGLVFGSSAAQPFTPTAVRKRALTAWRLAGLEPIGLHECRHTFASLLIAAGVNAKAITAYLGHASIQTTFDLYGHLMPGNEDEAVALVDAYLERAETRTRMAQLDRPVGT
jgi:integrase